MADGLLIARVDVTEPEEWPRAILADAVALAQVGARFRVKAARDAAARGGERD